jgi:hypothetical protein
MNTIPFWEVVSVSNDGVKIEQTIIPNNEDEAYKAYAIVKNTLDMYCDHYLIQNGIIIRHYIGSK